MSQISISFPNLKTYQSRDQKRYTFCGRGKRYFMSAVNAKNTQTVFLRSVIMYNAKAVLNLLAVLYLINTNECRSNLKTQKRKSSCKFCEY